MLRQTEPSKGRVRNVKRSIHWATGRWSPGLDSNQRPLASKAK